MPEICPPLFLGGALAILGIVACLAGALLKRSVVVLRGALLLLIGGATLWMHGDKPHWRGWYSQDSDRLYAIRSERRAVERSLNRTVQPLIARCQKDLAVLDWRGSHSSHEAQNQAERERQQILSVLNEAQKHERQHLVALRELDTALASLEREHALTRVKDVNRARALSHVAFSELRTTTSLNPTPR